jgi:phosphate transport system protein
VTLNQTPGRSSWSGRVEAAGHRRRRLTPILLVAGAFAQILRGAAGDFASTRSAPIVQRMSGMTAEGESSHTDRSYDVELAQVRARIIEMGDQVRRMIARSLEALLAGDAEEARRIIAADRIVNRLEVDTDALCLRVLARRQPVASDLRFLATAMKINTDLERLGDLCGAICERVIELTRPVDQKTGDHLTAMAARVRIMIDDALRAFTAGDAKIAQSVVDADRAIDEGYRDVFDALFEAIRREPASLPDRIRLQGVAKVIERMGDHATNIAEMVIFMVRGQDVRHRGRLSAVVPTNSHPADRAG